MPSTREITRQWGVAMATATKVLTELRLAGLVHAVPGVGTVVAARHRPAPPTPAPAPVRTAPAQALTLERIVSTATVVADREGLAAASMRRVAAELGVATMSLYRHVADKDELLTRMMDAAFAEWPLPATAPDGWRDRLELAARQLWRIFRSHPWLAPVLSLTRPRPVPAALPFTEWVLASLERRGLDTSTVFTAHLTLFNYIRGTAVAIEAETEAEAATGLDAAEWLDSQEPALLTALADGRFPAFERLIAAEYEFDLDSLFEFGLQRLLDGLAVLLGERL
ncbi:MULTISPECIES: TetR/AcrR family transcriptional regulator C-terminal domain-containing protein [unclassified Kitasatospora]|uniref:TetR/AcrR family transcriptional regulator C-terminal domain-containing protein n=1 Tax=unclassified Kitasatospora TaxID=2633591 RepID=UPI001F3E1B06|nr:MULTISPECIES: TetR/AcrR family transcriptional regulator C-terminal domain-containing protein [unclassified Kitasatospora]